MENDGQDSRTFSSHHQQNFDSQGKHRPFSSHLKILAQIGLGERFKPETPVEVLIQALYDQQATVRASAVRTLGEQGRQWLEEEGIQILVRLKVLALADEEWQVRVAAVRALSKLGDLNSGVWFVTILRHDTNGLVRAASARSLGDIEYRAAASALLHALYDDNWQVRASSLQALGSLREPALRLHLQEALHDHDSNVRIAALQAMRTLQEKAFLDHVAVIALQDDEWIVREKALSVLEELDAQKLADLLWNKHDITQYHEEEQNKHSHNIDTIMNMLVPDNPSSLHPWKEKREELHEEHILLSEDDTFPKALESRFDDLVYKRPYGVKVLQKEKKLKGTFSFQRQKIRKQENEFLLSENLKNGIRMWMQYLYCFSQKCWLKWTQWLKQSKKHSFLFSITAQGVFLSVLLLTFLLGVKSGPQVPSFAHGFQPIDQARISFQGNYRQALPGQQLTVSVKGVNTGTTTWLQKDGYRLTCLTHSLRNTGCQGIRILPMKGDIFPQHDYTFTIMLVVLPASNQYQSSLVMMHRNKNFGNELPIGEDEDIAITQFVYNFTIMNTLNLGPYISREQQSLSAMTAIKKVHVKGIQICLFPVIITFTGSTTLRKQSNQNPFSNPSI